MVATGLVLALLGPPAAAWGPLGHRAVGAVADALLTPGVRAEVARLLDDDGDGRPSARATLAEASLWADEIRGSEADRPAWHYDNMPVCGAPPAQPSWCPRGQCASGRIEPLLAQLADRTQPMQQRRQALKWIAHLVGDLHQPLHAADYAQGGTLVHVEFAGARHASAWTLHSAWDIRLVSSALHAGASQQPPVPALKSLIAHARRFAPGQLDAPVSEWVTESNRLAHAVVLAYPGFTCDQVPAEAVLLPVHYQKRAQRVITLQLALAGARLASILNRALASSSSPPPLPRSAQSDPIAPGAGWSAADCDAESDVERTVTHPLPLPSPACGRGEGERAATINYPSMSNFTPCASGNSPEKLIVLVARRM
jgi:hypothetical protein